MKPLQSLFIFTLLAYSAPSFAAVNDRTVKEVQIIMNEFRASYGACNSVSKQKRSRLSWNNELARLAKVHSDFLAQQGRLAHTGKDGQKLVARVDASDYEWRALAENLAQISGDAKDVLRLWLNSKAHAANMCNPDYSEVGIAENDGYWTAIFAQPAR